MAARTATTQELEQENQLVQREMENDSGELTVSAPDTEEKKNNREELRETGETRKRTRIPFLTHQRKEQLWLQKRDQLRDQLRERAKEFEKHQEKRAREIKEMKEEERKKNESEGKRKEEWRRK